MLRSFRVRSLFINLPLTGILALFLAAAPSLVGCKSDSDPHRVTGDKDAPADGDSDGGDAYIINETETGPVPCQEGHGMVGTDGGCYVPACHAGTKWSPGTLAFSDATTAWGLDTVEGIRLTVTDFDNDGWADLVVRKGGVAWSGARLLRNKHDKTFEDVTAASGFLTTRNDYGDGLGRPGDLVVFADIDNDGDLDAYVGLNTNPPAQPTYPSPKQETSEILINNGDGTFSLGEAVNDVRRLGVVDNPAGASFVDVDRDGFVDLWVAEYTDENGPMQDHLYRGNGAGLFTDITAASGLLTKPWETLEDLNAGLAHSQAWSATTCDLNNDGVPDLLAGSYGRAPNHLWQGALTGSTPSFTNRSVASGYAYDSNFDHRSDQNFLCYCADHSSATGCAGAADPAMACYDPNNPSTPVYSWSPGVDDQPFRLGGNSGATVCADIDNDGKLDLMTTEIKHWWTGPGSDGSEVLVNTGESDIRFLRPGRSVMGLSIMHPVGSTWDEGHITGAAFDFDNDGWKDLYIGATDYPGNVGLLFQQQSPLNFRQVPANLGIDMHRSHGVAVADFDRDGDLDVVTGYSAARCGGAEDCYALRHIKFFENQMNGTGNWIQLKLEGTTGTNRAAIGARVTVTAGGVTQTQEVGGGYGHYGAQGDLTLHFGLGTACVADVTIRWPNADLTTQSFTVPVSKRYYVRQGDHPLVAP